MQMIAYRCLRREENSQLMMPDVTMNHDLCLQMILPKKKKRLCQVCLGASAPHESSLHLPVGPLSSRHRQDPRSRAQLWQGKQQGLVHRCVSQPSPQPLLPSACFPSHPDCILRQQSPTFLAPEIVFMEDSFSTDGQGDGGGEGRMVWG